jgi:hypothetical protein
MEEQKISFETAKLAENKGCKLILYILTDNYSGADILCSQSILQKWLREKHRIYITVEPFWEDTEDMDCLPEFQPQLWFDGSVEDDDYVYHKTYEEALERGLQEALHLIKL